MLQGLVRHCRRDQQPEVHNAADGISPAEAIVIEERLTPVINKVLNVPLLTERMEAKLIGLAVGIINE